MAFAPIIPSAYGDSLSAISQAANQASGTIAQAVQKWQADRQESQFLDEMAQQIFQNAKASGIPLDPKDIEKFAGSSIGAKRAIVSQNASRVANHYRDQLAKVQLQQAQQEADTQKQVLDFLKGLSGGAPGAPAAAPAPPPAMPTPPPAMAGQQPPMQVPMGTGTPSRAALMRAVTAPQPPVAPQAFAPPQPQSVGQSVVAKIAAAAQSNPALLASPVVQNILQSAGAIARLNGAGRGAASPLGKLQSDHAAALAAGDTVGAAQLQSIIDKQTKQKAEGKALTQDELSRLAALNQAETDLNNLETLYKGLGADYGGPVSGRVKSAVGMGQNPNIASLQNAIIAATPNLARGVFREVGVLTDEDVKRYQKLLPSPYDTDAVRATKIKQLRTRISEGRTEQVKALREAGRDVAGIEAGMNAPATQVQQFNSEADARSAGKQTGDIVEIYDPETASYRKARLK